MCTRLGQISLPVVARGGLVLAALVRINLWALLYVLLAGWLRFMRAGALSWTTARLLLLLSIAMQYSAALSLPPALWPKPHRRPWVGFGSGMHIHSKWLLPAASREGRRTMA